MLPSLWIIAVSGSLLALLQPSWAAPRQVYYAASIFASDIGGCSPTTPTISFTFTCGVGGTAVVVDDFANFNQLPCTTTADPRTVQCTASQLPASTQGFAHIPSAIVACQGDTPEAWNAVITVPSRTATCPPSSGVVGSEQTVSVSRICRNLADSTFQVDSDATATCIGSQDNGGPCTNSALCDPLFGASCDQVTIPSMGVQFADATTLSDLCLFDVNDKSSVDATSSVPVGSVPRILYSLLLQSQFLPQATCSTTNTVSSSSSRLELSCGDHLRDILTSDGTTQVSMVGQECTRINRSTVVCDLDLPLSQAQNHILVPICEGITTHDLALTTEWTFPPVLCGGNSPLAELVGTLNQACDEPQDNYGNYDADLFALECGPWNAARLDSVREGNEGEVLFAFEKCERYQSLFCQGAGCEFPDGSIRPPALKIRMPADKIRLDCLYEGSSLTDHGTPTSPNDPGTPGVPGTPGNPAVNGPVGAPSSANCIVAWLSLMVCLLGSLGHVLAF